jgi:hypothetical protein
MTQFGPGRPGQGKSIRQILKECNENDEQLKANPLWQQGFEDGYKEAMENQRQLSAALHNVYRIDRFGE